MKSLSRYDEHEDPKVLR